jgi:hypothetical protein
MSDEEGHAAARHADLDKDAMRAIKEALGRIQYGSILITIHQGEVVGIETSTKVRIRRH